MNRVSLLYPAEYAEERDKAGVDRSFYMQLGLERLIRIPVKGTLPWIDQHEQFAQLFTSNTEVIQYRLDVVEDLLKNPGLVDVLIQALPQIETIAVLRADKSRASDVISCLYSIADIELYTNCVDLLHKALSEAEVSSQGLKALFEILDEVQHSGEYQNLKESSHRLMDKMRGIKSVTIGVNLNAQLHAVEAGVVSVNSEYFRSGDIIDRILRLDRTDDGFRCLTPLIPYGASRGDHKDTAFNSAILNALDIIFSSAVRNWRPLIRRYLAQNTDYLVSLAKEIRLLLGAVELARRMRALGMPMCKPEVCPMEEKALSLRSFYNPHIAVSLGESRADEMVFNNLDFDSEGMIYVLTGANRGGKTAVTYGVGIIQALFQLGFYVPARSARLSPVDNIFVHFPSTGESIGKGRLGEECDNLRQIAARVSEYSMVLMDEALSSTSAVEAVFIASEVLLGLSSIGVRGIFSTHLHDLAQRVDELNRHSANKAKIDNLVAEVEPDTTNRTFKILRAKPDGLSYARSIAEQYGITLDQILQARRQQRAGR